MVVIYTDIEAPSDKKFTEQYGGYRRATSSALYGDVLYRQGEKGSLTASPPAQRPSLLAALVTLDGNPEKRFVTGTFDGVRGSFTCTATLHSAR